MFVCCFFLDQDYQSLIAVHREFSKTVEADLATKVLGLLKRASLTRAEGIFMYRLATTDATEKVEMRGYCKVIAAELTTCDTSPASMQAVLAKKFKDALNLK